MNEIEALPESADEMDAAIAGAILKALRASENPSQKILLSALGNVLSKRFGPLRQHLGRRTTLSKIIGSQLSGQVVIEGVGNGAAARLEGETQQPSQSRRYDKTFWAAFAKPLEEGHRRFLNPTRPFSFNDSPEETASARQGWIEIEAQRVPAREIPRYQRDKLVISAIEEWCHLHRLEPETFGEAPQEPSGNATPSKAYFPNHTSAGNAGRPAGLAALRNLIEAVPPQERSKFSLNLDLLHRLISGS